LGRVADVLAASSRGPGQALPARALRREVRAPDRHADGWWGSGVHRASDSRLLPPPGRAAWHAGHRRPLLWAGRAGHRPGQAVGLEKPSDPEKMQQFMMQLRHGDILVSDSPDTKFGALPETPLDGFIRAAQWDVETLASISQTPTYELTGQLVNLSADALVAARGGQMRKTSDWQQALGSQYAQWLRLGAYLEGNFEDAEDVHGRVTWQDMEVRSLSQAVDAYGKAAQMLGVPKQALWSRIPGVEQSDVEEWKQMAEDNALENFQAELERQTRDLLGNNQGGEAE